MAYIIGQILGVIASAACVVVPLFKKKWQMLVNTAVVNLLIALNFILIDQIGSAVGLCLVAVVQSLVSLYHTRRGTEITRAEGIVFSLLYVGFGLFGLVSAPGFVWALSARNLLELLPIIGSLLNMCFVFVREEQKARRFLLAASSVWAVYMAVIRSTSFFAQIVCFSTTCYAMYRYRRAEQK